jgi:hypothetical protein
MTPIQVACPNCRVTLKLAGSAEGKAVKCPKCGTVFRVAPPRAAAAPQPATAVARKTAPQAPPPARAGEDRPARQADGSKRKSPAPPPARGHGLIILAAVLGGLVLLGGGALAVVALSWRAPQKQTAQLPDQPVLRPPAPVDKRPPEAGPQPARPRVEEEEDTRKPSRSRPVPDADDNRAAPPDPGVARRPLPPDPTPEPDEPVEKAVAGPGEDEKPLLVLDAGGHTAPAKKVLWTPDGGGQESNHLIPHSINMRRVRKQDALWLIGFDCQEANLPWRRPVMDLLRLKLRPRRHELALAPPVNEIVTLATLHELALAPPVNEVAVARLPSNSG